MFCLLSLFFFLSFPLQDQPWLCAELVVPKKSHCTVLVPTNLERGALVTDKMGQGMFRSSRVARFQPWENLGLVQPSTIANMIYTASTTFSKKNNDKPWLTFEKRWWGSREWYPCVVLFSFLGSFWYAPRRCTGVVLKTACTFLTLFVNPKDWIRRRCTFKDSPPKT